MLLSNLSDGPCETKDVIVENEAMLRKLAELLVCIMYSYMHPLNVTLPYTAASTHQCSVTHCMHLCCKTSH